MRIGLRYRRAGMIDRILIPKRASIARMLAGPLFPPRRRARTGVASALQRAPRAPLHPGVELDLRPPADDEPASPLSPVERAIAYAHAGVRVISVPTDGPFGGGSFDLLARCRDALDDALGEARPLLLCRDFILQPIQIDRALDAGADLVGLVARVLDPGGLAALIGEARERGITPLVEVASADEITLALAAGARLFGVSARDLNTQKVVPGRAATLLDHLGPDVVAVSLDPLDTVDAVIEASRTRADTALIRDVLALPGDQAERLRALIDALTTAKG